MSLRTKFVLLLATVGAAIAIMLSTSIWSISVFEREMGGSLHSIGSVLGGLNQLKRTFQAQAQLVGASHLPFREATRPVTPERRTLEPEFEALVRESHRTLTALEGLDSYKVRSGVSRTRALREGALEVERAGQAWIASGNAADFDRLLAALSRQIDRIETIVSEILTDAQFAFAHGQRIRSFVNVAVLAATALVLVAALLGAVLVRRWVLSPVAALRDAAAHIGAGDFDYRVPVKGRDEIARLSGEINHMARLVGRLQEERISRERFAAVGEMLQKLVHNIRGPLGGVRTLADLTRRNAEDAQTVRDSQGRIIRTVDRFESWITDLLGATRPLQIAPETVHIGRWLDGVLEAHRAQAAARGLELEVSHEGPESARFDPRLVEQALSAVVSNALEVTPGGGRVRVDARPDGEAGRWRLVVADEGPGIPPDVSNRIFEAYFTTKKTGTGIGLALARRVAEQHGGHLWLGRTSSQGESETGRSSGATFVFELPITGTPNGGQ